jgi:hypothetical protein
MLHTISRFLQFPELFVYYNKGKKLCKKPHFSFEKKPTNFTAVISAFIALETSEE